MVVRTAPGLVLLLLAFADTASSARLRSSADNSRRHDSARKGKTRVLEILQSGLKAPWHGSGWYSAYSDKEVCDYLCKSQCMSATDHWAPPMCQNCRNSCMSFQTCEPEGGSEDCLVDRACSVFAYNKMIKAGNQPDGTPPWEFCGKYPGDGTCGSCKSCIAEGCHYTPGGAQCGGPWGDCCMQRCLGAKPYPR